MGRDNSSVMTILVIGVTIINNYYRLKNMEKNVDRYFKTSGRRTGTNQLPVSAQYNIETEKITEQHSEIESEEITEQQTEIESEKEKKETEKIQQQQNGEAEFEIQAESKKSKKRQNVETEEIEEVSARLSQAVYIVKNGSTLAGICHKYYGNLDKVEEICLLNDITDQDEMGRG